MDYWILIVYYDNETPRKKRIKRTIFVSAYFHGQFFGILEKKSIFLQNTNISSQRTALKR